MEHFAHKKLTDGGVIIVNGFFPSLTPKQILAAAAAALSQRDATDNLQSLSNENLLHRIALATSAPAQQQQQHHQQQHQQRQQHDNGQVLQLPGPAGAAGAGNGGGASQHQPPNANTRRLYIVLHNIDGQQLRSPEAQALLGELAAMPRVHLIAVWGECPGGRGLSRYAVCTIHTTCTPP